MCRLSWMRTMTTKDIWTNRAAAQLIINLKVLLTNIFTWPGLTGQTKSVMRIPFFLLSPLQQIYTWLSITLFTTLKFTFKVRSTQIKMSVVCCASSLSLLQFCCAKKDNLSVQIKVHNPCFSCIFMYIHAHFHHGIAI